MFRRDDRFGNKTNNNGHYDNNDNNNTVNDIIMTND